MTIQSTAAARLTRLCRTYRWAPIPFRIRRKPVARVTMTNRYLDSRRMRRKWPIWLGHRLSITSFMEFSEYRIKQNQVFQQQQNWSTCYNNKWIISISATTEVQMSKNSRDCHSSCASDSLAQKRNRVAMFSFPSKHLGAPGNVTWWCVILVKVPAKDWAIWRKGERPLPVQISRTWDRRGANRERLLSGNFLNIKKKKTL